MTGSTDKPACDATGAATPLPAGVIVPILTPLTAAERIDEAATELLVEFLLRAGVDGIFLLGSAGEGDSLPDELQRDYADLVLTLVARRVPLLLGVMRSGTLQQVRFLESYARCAEFAAVVTPVPFYRHLRCEAEVLEHLRRVGASSPRPLVLYYTPDSSASVLTPDVLMRLAGEGLICAFKDSSGRVEPFRELIARGFNRNGLRIYQGEPRLSLESLQLGGDGVIPGTANFIPWLFVDMIRALRTGDALTAARCQAEILAFRRFARIVTPFSKSGFHYSTFKAGLDVMEFGGGRPSAPLQPPPRAVLAEMRPYFDSAEVLQRAAQTLAASRLSARARRWAALRGVVKSDLETAAEHPRRVAAAAQPGAVLGKPTNADTAGRPVPEVEE